MAIPEIVPQKISEGAIKKGVGVRSQDSRK
jgi:hypothetical protein